MKGRIMLNNTKTFKEYLADRQETIDSEKPQNESEPNELFNENTFYQAFVKDMLNAKKEIIIYSPFVTKFRTDFFEQTIETLRKRNVEIFIFTRQVKEYDFFLQPQIESIHNHFKELGICVFHLGESIHQKLAIIDQEILWEGSLNILSQKTSKEMMRRTRDRKSATQVISYLGLTKKLAEGYRLNYERLNQKPTNPKRAFRLKLGVALLELTILITAIWIFSGPKGIMLLIHGIEFMVNMLGIFNFR
jgi:phosphatidylserine/phosphatidylglycerophosphate/cardiolipin synthase-like enzyme